MSETGKVFLLGLLFGFLVTGNGKTCEILKKFSVSVPKNITTLKVILKRCELNDPSCKRIEKINITEIQMVKQFEMRNITECCKGYQITQDTPLICEPYCTKRIEQGNCTGPNEYVCWDGYNMIEGPDLIKCFAQCDNCKHGNCIGPNICKCGLGYQNGIDPGTCEPICNSGCPNGKCTHPEVCECNEGEDTSVTEVPWHVAIYQNSAQICGGTIVSERVVISAAHCFSSSTNQTHSFDVKDFKVIAGKTQRGLLAREALKKQSRDIQEVAIPDRYDGHISYRADIATVIISGQFFYRPHISPACLQFFEFASQKYPRSGTMALVAGWGTTTELRPSEILQSFNIPVVDLEACQEQAPPFYKDRVIGDKICAGYVDSDRSYSKVVCPGDSGGGFLIPKMVAGKRQYFLQGVVSNSRRTLDCDREFYTLFTNVQDYKEFLSEGIEKGAATWIEMVTVTSHVTEPPVDAN